MKDKTFIITLGDNFDFFFSVKLNRFYILGKYGVSVFYMPSLFFFKGDSLSFSFLSRFFFISFIKHLISHIKKVIKVFFFSLRLKGLGYRIRIVENKMIKFFFGYNFFFFLYIPRKVIFIKDKKTLIVFSANKQLLNEIFHNIIRLKKFDYYDRNNMFLVRNKIIYFKKRK